MKKVLDAGQSADQAGFRPGYSTDDHLFVTTMLFERAAEWGAPIWIAAVDFKKAFDSVSHDELFAAMLEMGVEAAYVNVLKRLYAGQTANVVTDKISKDFEIKRGTKQGDPISPILFNAVLETVVSSTACDDTRGVCRSSLSMSQVGSPLPLVWGVGVACCTHSTR